MLADRCSNTYLQCCQRYLEQSVDNSATLWILLNFSRCKVHNQEIRIIKDWSICPSCTQWKYYVGTSYSHVRTEIQLTSKYTGWGFLKLSFQRSTATYPSVKTRSDIQRYMCCNYSHEFWNRSRLTAYCWEGRCPPYLCTAKWRRVCSKSQCQNWLHSMA